MDHKSTGKRRDDEYSEAEAAKRRDAITKAMIATPPQKHEPLKERKHKGRSSHEMPTKKRR